MKQVLQEQVDSGIIHLEEEEIPYEEFFGLSFYDKIFDDEGKWKGGYRKHPRFLNEYS